MAEYVSNSHRSKDLATSSDSKRKMEVEKVVTGKVKTKKKNGASKFVDNFISEDAKNIKSYIVDDLAVPTLKKFLFDAGHDILETLLYGREGGRGRSESGRSRVSYARCWDDRRDRERRDNTRNQVRTRFDYDELIFETRGDAERVYDDMCDLIKRYNLVTVAAMYDLANVPLDNYTANDYGWTNLNVHEPIKRVHGGYILNLPRAMPIE